MKLNRSIILLLLMIFILIIPSIVHADILSETIKKGSDFLKEGQNTYTYNPVYDDEGKIKEEYKVDKTISEEQKHEIAGQWGEVFNILVSLGTIIVVVVGGILGIKYMAASAEDKANIKETMTPYILGAIVIFGAFGIWKMVTTVLTSIV